MYTPIGSSAPHLDPQLAAAMRDYQRQRQMTLGDLLLENRVIFLQGEIYDGNANELVMKLLYLQSENRRKDIHFYINSPGGSVTRDAGDLRHDADDHAARGDLLRRPRGQRRRRAAGRRREGQAIRPAAREDHDPPAARRRRRAGLRHRDSGQRNHPHPRTPSTRSSPATPASRIEEIAKACDRDYYMTALEAKAFGLVDDILTKPPGSEEAEDED